MEKENEEDAEAVESSAPETEVKPPEARELPESVASDPSDIIINRG